MTKENPVHIPRDYSECEYDERRRTPLGHIIALAIVGFGVILVLTISVCGMAS